MQNIIKIHSTIIECDLDLLKDERKLHAQQLKKANVSMNLLTIQGVVHPFYFPISDNFYNQRVAGFKHI